MRFIKTCALGSLKFGNYFQFKGRNQIYFVCDNVNGVVYYINSVGIPYSSSSGSKNVELLDF